MFHEPSTDDARSEAYHRSIMRILPKQESVAALVVRHAGVLVAFIVAAIALSAVPVEAERTMTLRSSALKRPSTTEGFVRAARSALSSGSKLNVLLPSELKSAARDKSERVVGGYFTASHAGDSAYMEDEFARMKAAGVSAFVFDVKGSRAYFASQAPMATELGLIVPLVEIPALVAKAKEHGFYTIARFIALKDSGLAGKAAGSHIRHPASKRSVGAAWVDGSVPETLRYNRELLIEIASSGVDEINLDYIRYPTEYAPSQIGLSGAEKGERIGRFLVMAREAVDSTGKGTKLGISTYAILGWNFPVNFEPLGQDIPEFAKLVDIVSPMAYPATFAEGHYYIPGKHPRSRMYYLVWQTLEGYKKLVGPQNVHKLRPWIQGYYAGAKDLQDQIDAVYNAGLCGFTVWSAGNHYDTFYSVWKKQPDREDNCKPASFDAASPVQ